MFFYVRYGVLYRDLEEIMEERGVEVDHSTLNRWVVNFSPLIAIEAQKRKHKTASSWRMDETYIKVKGKCPVHDSCDFVLDFRPMSECVFGLGS